MSPPSLSPSLSLSLSLYSWALVDRHSLLPLSFPHLLSPISFILSTHPIHSSSRPSSIYSIYLPVPYPTSFISQSSLLNSPPYVHLYAEETMRVMLSQTMATVHCLRKNWELKSRDLWAHVTKHNTPLHIVSNIVWQWVHWEQGDLCLKLPHPSPHPKHSPYLPRYNVQHWMLRTHRCLLVESAD